MPPRNRPSGSSGSRGQQGARGSVPREAEQRRRGAGAPPPPTPPGGPGQWVVPGVLGVVLVGVAVWFVKTSNQVPAEPPGHVSDTSQTVPGGSPTNPTNPTPSQPLVPPPPPPPTEVPAQAQNVEVTPVHPEPTSPDPRHGHFTLADATAGMPAGTTLKADITTSMGTFTCDLWPDRAPVNVANFVGLARGVRDFWDPVGGAWVRRPFYDNSVFHRVIPGFMIQGGDILRSGHGDPGYEIPDENISPHDQPGLLCMANHGPNTAGGQFFILEQPKPHLDTSYSIFGRCQPTSLVTQIAGVPRDPRDRPLNPVWIRSVRIHR